MDETSELRSQAARCRRLAGSINDEQARSSLEQLARDYESRAGDASSDGSPDPQLND
jgi:hypothetical protein